MATKKVGVIKHEKYGIEVPLRLETDSMTFVATWERPTPDATGIHVVRHTERGKDGEEVRDAMLAFIEAQMAIVWEPVVEVIPMHGFASSEQIRATASCAMAVTRFWLGRPAVGDMQRAEWHIKPEDRSRTSRPFYVTSSDSRMVYSKDFTFPFRAKPRHYGAERIYLAFSEELWAGLTLIEQRINEARKMLETMLGTDEALERVAELGAQVLPGLLAAPSAPEGE